jgi:hypothetical protein
MTRRALIALTCGVASALAACAGKELIDLGGDASRGAAGDADSDGAMYWPETPTGVFPCAESVCTSPQVCCQQMAAVARCVMPGQCNDFAAACNVNSCPTGSVCCGSMEGGDTLSEDGGGHVTGSTQCVQGTVCPDGTQQACGLSAPPLSTPPHRECPCNFGCSGTVLFTPLFCVAYLDAGDACL